MAQRRKYFGRTLPSSSGTTHRLRRGPGLLRTVAIVAAIMGLFGGPLAGTADAMVDYSASADSFGGVVNATNEPPGRVEETLLIGDQLWVAGIFDTATPAGGAPDTPMTNLVQFDINTGELEPRTIDTDGETFALAHDGEGTAFVGGDFATIGGEPARRLASIDVLRGTQNEAFDLVGPDGAVLDLLLHDDGWLYVAGRFQWIGNRPISHLARVNPTTGELDETFAPNPDAWVFEIAAHGDVLYAVGEFEAVGSVDRRWISAIDLTTGLASPIDFYAPPLTRAESEGKAGFRTLVLSADGTHLYTGDDRNDVIKWDTATGTRVWEIQGEGDVQAIALSEDESIVYAAVHEGWYVDYDKRLAVAIDESTGVVDDSWAPLYSGWWGPFAIEVIPGALVTAGEFNRVNGIERDAVAIFRSPTWQPIAPLAWNGPVGDNNCDDRTDLLDALGIVQYFVGLRSGAAECMLGDAQTEIYLPGSDIDGDGAVDPLDALLISQCYVGLPNAFCSEADA